MDSSEVYLHEGIIMDINIDNPEQPIYAHWKDMMYSDYGWWIAENAIRLVSPPSKILAKLLEVLDG